MADVKLTVNGKTYAGWKSVRVTKSIEAIAAGFDLSVSDRWNGQSKPWAIVEEDNCTLALAGQTIVTGTIDRRRVSYSSTDHTFEVSGRDLTGMLVDCSAQLGTWEFNSLSILTLARMLAKPYGVKVTMGKGVRARSLASTGDGIPTLKFPGADLLSDSANNTLGLGIPTPPKKFCVSPGEASFEVLERACKTAGVLPVSDGKGGILLTRAGDGHASTALVEGQNILAANAEYDVSGRYRTYKVSAQHPGEDTWFGKSLSVQAVATDRTVKRAARTLMLRAESTQTAESARARAAWEAKTRAAKGEVVSVVVQGWTQQNGELWPINSFVKIHSPTIGVSGEMLITQCVYSLDDNSGTTTQITLKRPDAFKPEPQVVGSGGWKEIARGVPRLAVPLVSEPT